MPKRLDPNFPSLPNDNGSVRPTDLIDVFRKDSRDPLKTYPYKVPLSEITFELPPERINFDGKFVSYPETLANHPFYQEPTLEDIRNTVALYWDGPNNVETELLLRWVELTISNNCIEHKTALEQALSRTEFLINQTTVAEFSAQAEFDTWRNETLQDADAMANAGYDNSTQLEFVAEQQELRAKESTDNSDFISLLEQLKVVYQVVIAASSDVCDNL